MKGNGTPDNTDFADEKAIGVIREIRGSFSGDSVMWVERLV